MKIGIIGAGLQGSAIARCAVRHGYEVLLCNSRGPETLQTLCNEIGCRAINMEQLIEQSEIVVLSIPLFNVFKLNSHLLDGQIVMDTVNYYPDRDGHFKPLDERKITTSSLLSNYFTGAHWVKALNAILAIDLVENKTVLSNGTRRAIPIAGNEIAPKQRITELLKSLEFDVLDTGNLGNSWRFERAKPAYCFPFDKAGLSDAIAGAEWHKELPDGSWRR